MKKILLVTNHYLPGYKAGGPIKSISSLCSSISNIFDLFVMTSDRDSGDKQPYSNISQNKLTHANVLYLSEINILSVLKGIRQINPDLIHLNSFFSKFSQIILFLNKIGLISCKIIISPRGELSSGALSIKSAKKKYYFQLANFLGFYNKNIILHATDNTEYNDIKKTFDFHSIYNIANLTAMSEIKFNNERFNDLYIVKFIFISRISRKKNLDYALDVLKKYNGVRKIKFDIYGTKEDSTYWNECENKIESFSNNVEINYISSLEPSQINETLQQYHIFFLPTKNENFGHAIVEAMQNGTIPLISDQTPWNDLAQYNAGWSIGLEDSDKFVSVIERIVNMDTNAINTISLNSIKYIHEKLNIVESKQSYILMYNEIMDES